MFVPKTRGFCHMHNILDLVYFSNVSEQQTYSKTGVVYAVRKAVCTVYVYW